MTAIRGVVDVKYRIDFIYDNAFRPSNAPLFKTEEGAAVWIKLYLPTNFSYVVTKVYTKNDA